MSVVASVESIGNKIQLHDIVKHLEYNSSNLACENT